MDALNTKIKNIKTEKALKVRPENIKSGVSVFGITGTFEGNSDYAKFVEQDSEENNLICYIYKPILQEGDLEDIEDIFENNNSLIQNLLDIVESDTSMIEDTLQNMDIDVLEDIITLCDIAYDLFLYRDEDNSYIRLLHIESTSSNSADIYNPTLDYGIYGVSFELETDAETGDTNVVVGEIFEFIDTSGTDATASDILDGKTAYVNGEYIEGTLVPSAGKNIQMKTGMYVNTRNGYQKSGLKLTVAKTGTYTIKWMAERMSTSGTNGTALYIDGTRYGSNYETWGMPYYKDNAEVATPHTNYQYITIEHVSLTQGQELEIYSRANSNGNWLYNYDLIIEEE